MKNSVIRGMKADYRCDACGNSQQVNIFPYINFSENPEYYALVKDLEIFKVKCEKCGSVKIVQFDTLIVDETHKYFIYLLSDRSLYNRFKYQITYFVETTLNKDDKYDLDEYKTRLVFSPNDLLEKMNLFEIGLNDEVIELAKVGLVDRGLVDRKIYDMLYFDSIQNANLEFVAFSSKSSTVKPLKFSINYEFYNRVLDDVQRFKTRDSQYFAIVDEDSMRSKFKLDQVDAKEEGGGAEPHQ